MPKHIHVLTLRSRYDDIALNADNYLIVLVYLDEHIAPRSDNNNEVRGNEAIIDCTINKYFAPWSAIVPVMSHTQRIAHF